MCLTVLCLCSQRNQYETICLKAEVIGVDSQGFSYDIKYVSVRFLGSKKCDLCLQNRKACVVLSRTQYSGTRVDSHMNWSLIICHEHQCSCKGNRISDHSPSDCVRVRLSACANIRRMLRATQETHCPRIFEPSMRGSLLGC